MNQNRLQVVVSTAAGQRTGTSKQRAGVRSATVVTSRSWTSGVFWSLDGEKQLFTGWEHTVVNEGIVYLVVCLKFLLIKFINCCNILVLSSFVLHLLCLIFVYILWKVLFPCSKLSWLLISFFLVFVKCLHIVSYHVFIGTL